MKVLHLRASNFYGGPERQLHLHAREALGSSLQLTIASFHESGEPPEFLDPIAADGIATHSFDVRSAYDPRAVSAVRHYLHAHDIDLLCTHEYRSALVAWIAVRGSRTRWIAFSRGFTTENLKVRAYQWIDRILIRHAHHVVAVSASQKQKLERLRIPSSRISVVPNAIDAEFIGGAAPVDLRSRYGFASGDFVCVAGGRFSEEKGQVFLVEAAARALRDTPRLRVIMFGDGPQRARILERIARLGIGDQVLCPGFERNMAGCVRAADLLVNPSLSEGMPNIVLEAMGLCTPVLATAVGGVPEIIEDGVSGRLVAPADPGALAARLQEAVQEQERSRTMAERAARFAREELGFARQFERMCEAYRKGVGRHD